MAFSRTRKGFKLTGQTKMDDGVGKGGGQLFAVDKFGVSEDVLEIAQRWCTSYED